MYADGRIQWTTGENSGGYNGLGGTEALVGINAGDYINYVTVPGSQTPDIINITKTSNIDVPGVWMFQVGRGTYNYVSITKCNCFTCLYCKTLHCKLFLTAFTYEWIS